MKKSSYPLSSKLIALAETLPSLPSWTVDRIILNWFQEYEHGTADPEDISEEITLRGLASFTGRLLRHMAANFTPSSSPQEVRQGLDSQIEANELRLGSYQEAILEDLLLTLKSLEG